MYPRVYTCLHIIFFTNHGIQIAAISPADINYEETLSTLRFADRAKSIKTQAVVNESATEKMIRELKEENEKLQSMIKSGGKEGSQVSLNYRPTIRNLSLLILTPLHPTPFHSTTITMSNFSPFDENVSFVQKSS